MRYAVESDDVPIAYNAKFREYGMRVLDGGTSVIQLIFCPLCGQRLQRASEWRGSPNWQKRGIEAYEGEVPPKFDDDRWYSTR